MLIRLKANLRLFLPPLRLLSFASSSPNTSGNEGEYRFPLPVIPHGGEAGDAEGRAFAGYLSISPNLSAFRVPFGPRNDRLGEGSVLLRAELTQKKFQNLSVAVGFVFGFSEAVFFARICHEPQIMRTVFLHFVH